MKSFADTPIRQLTRLRSELAIASAQLTAGMFPDQPLLGIEFGIVARVSLPDWAGGLSIAAPPAPTRTITIRQMALSLGGPPETTRRHVRQLVDRGVLASSPRGIALSTAPHSEAVIQHYYRTLHDLFVRLVEDVAATTDLYLSVGHQAAFGAGEVIERALDTLLLPIDTFRMIGATRLAHLLWGALAVAAVRGVTYDPALSRLYADAIPPDELRLSISLRSLAASLSIPYATAWRRVQALEQKGLVTRTSSDRWSVLSHNLLQDNVRDISTPPTMLMLTKVRELALLGLDPAHAARHYLAGRPALANLASVPANQA